MARLLLVVMVIVLLSGCTFGVPQRVPKTWYCFPPKAWECQPSYEGSLM